MQAEAITFDPRELRRTFGSFVTGVTIVTALDAHGHPVGLTANSFSSVSMDPPLVLWSQSLTAPSHAVFRNAERFAINILADDQAGLSDRFARGGTDKFAGIGVRSGLGGVPLLDGAAALFECTRMATYPGGDHAIFVGRVERFERHGRAPLVFAAGSYVSIGATPAGSPQRQAAPQIE